MQICHMQQFHEKRRDFHQMEPKMSREGWNNLSKFFFYYRMYWSMSNWKFVSWKYAFLEKSILANQLNFPSRRNENYEVF